MPPFFKRVFYSLGSGAIQVGTSKLIKTTAKKTIATGSAGISENPSKEPPPTKSTKDCAAGDKLSN